MEKQTSFHAESLPNKREAYRNIEAAACRKFILASEMGATLEMRGSLLDIKLKQEAPVRGKLPEDFDPADLFGSPEYEKTVRYAVPGNPSSAYVCFVRKDAKGRESTTVGPDADGTYPSAQDLRAALNQTLARSIRSKGFTAEQIVSVLSSYRPKKDEWVKEAGKSFQTEASVASNIIDALIELHGDRLRKK